MSLDFIMEIDTILFGQNFAILTIVVVGGCSILRLTSKEDGMA